MSELTPVRRERIQSKVTKLILQDAEPEKLDQIISVNELSDADAKQMIDAARKERVDVIRGLCMKNVYLGCMVMMLGVAVVYSIILFLGNMTKPMWVVAGFMEVLGLWKIIEGVGGIVMAPKKKGAFEKS